MENDCTRTSRESKKKYKLILMLPQRFSCENLILPFSFMIEFIYNIIYILGRLINLRNAFNLICLIEHMLNRPRKVSATKDKTKFNCEEKQYYRRISDLFCSGTDRGHLSISSEEISREVTRSLIGSEVLDVIKSAKIAPSRFRRLAASVHRSIYPSIHSSIRLLCPSKPNAKDDASSSGGPAVSRGLSFATHAVPRSFVRPLATADTIVVKKTSTAVILRLCDDQQHLHGVARAAP